MHPLKAHCVAIFNAHRDWVPSEDDNDKKRIIGIITGNLHRFRSVCHTFCDKKMNISRDGSKMFGFAQGQKNEEIKGIPLL